MLIKFSIENFKSIGKKQTLFMEPTRKLKADDYLLQTNISKKPELIPCSVIMGANASGKSTIIKAFFFLQWILEHSDERKKSELFLDERFKLNPGYLQKPTAFYISFIADDNFLYEYTLVFSPHKIEKEILTCTRNKKGSRKITLINRNNDETQLHPSIHQDPTLLKLWTADINDKRTFLAYLSNKGEINIFDSVMHWFNSIKWLGNQKTPHIYTSAMINKGDINPKKIISLLKAADINIDGLSIKEKKSPPSPELSKLIADELSKISDESSGFILKELQDAKILDLNFEHIDTEGNAVSFDFEEQESDGTKQFYSIAGPILDALKTGSPIFIDELDQSLHPFLVRKIVQLFKDKQTNPNKAQLIFTTHDITVLDRTLLRPDEIYFTEKDPESFETALYSLAEFKGMGKNDRGSKIFNSYLSGKFGAVPYVKWEEGF